MYTESKKTLDQIRNRVGEAMFRMALTHAMDVGFRHLTDECIKETCDEIMKEDDSKHIMSNKFQCNIVKEAGEIAKLSPVDVEIYINREMEFDLSDGHIQRGRLITILQNALDYIYDDIQDSTSFCRILDNEIGMYKYEIKELGFDWALDCIGEE